MKSTIDATLEVKQIEYKNAELVLCEFLALQEYDAELINVRSRMPMRLPSIS